LAAQFSSLLPQLSRRQFLALAAASPAVAAVGTLTPAEWRRYPDPATDMEVIRLTDPAFASGMTVPHLRQFTRRSEWFLYWSERTGTPQAFLANLKTGESEQLTEAAALDPKSLALAHDERSFFFFDGPELYEGSFPKVAAKQIYRLTEGAVRTGFTMAGDGSVLFAESSSGRTRIMRVQRQRASRAFELDGDVDDLIARPGNNKSRLRLLYRQDGALWVAGLDGTGRRALKVEPGQTGEALWIPSGASLTYLHIPENPKELITLREHNPDTGADTLLARTSQFISAHPNADASVFVAASRSIASPYVLIMLRAMRRELTLAEHHASDPRMVSPVFTPDSKTILFVSDRHGKPAIYLMGVGHFVEETSGDSGPDAPAPEIRSPRRQ
jgi:oligogalacturonide lyase